MKKSTFAFRSDIAKECIEKVYGEDRFDLDGIETVTEEHCGMRVDSVSVNSAKGAEKIGKPMGNYVTIETGDLKNATKNCRDEVCKICADELRRLLPKGKSCLVACLGNRTLAADSQGPLCAENLIVTRHLKQNMPEIFSSLSLFELSCIVPDVLGNTGIESADTIKHIAEYVKPDFIIAVDSLAASNSNRIGKTLQITNTGISPGSGIGNRRSLLNEETMGVPVIAMGIPTVADAITVGADVLSRCLSQNKYSKMPEEVRAGILEAVLGSGSEGFFLTPKDTDRISLLAGQIIGMTINMALNPFLSVEEIYELSGKA